MRLEGDLKKAKIIRSAEDLELIAARHCTPVQIEIVSFRKSKKEFMTFDKSLLYLSPLIGPSSIKIDTLFCNCYDFFA